MNQSTLDILIDKYEEKIDLLYGPEYDEKFKWKALKTFQEEWFSDKYTDFISRFNAATKDFDILIDNSRMHPRNGVVKLYEKDPTEVERLFCDVLFADDCDDIDLRQQHMEAFLVGMESLRAKYYPGNWSFKQDRHSASTFLAMYAPAKNYVYKYNEAETMSVYGEYGFDIGSGNNFSLQRYYGMCDEIVERLNQHKSLLEKHFEKLGPNYYCDESLHLLAFDLIYCCRTYCYYKGLVHMTKQDALKNAKKALEQQKAIEDLQAKLDDVDSLIEDLELSMPDVSDISLINVEMSSQVYGVGNVIEQELNKITVAFPGVTKTFILDKKFAMRPTFENDAEVVDAYSEYTAAQQKLKTLKLEHTELQMKLNKLTE